MLLALMDDIQRINNLNNSILTLENYIYTKKFILINNPADEIIDLIIKTPRDIKNILAIRELVINILNNNNDINDIFKDTLQYFINIEHKNIHSMINSAAHYQTNMIKGNRDIIHLEAYLIHLYTLY